ncbi:sensor histidine kinase [Chitinophaga sp. Hz27]|uniref:sensor histidine kinase n=1 Tax=Chitinophaga sp. Hz27 TaxID=3347169 RepID=UPI0035E188E6
MSILFLIATAVALVLLVLFLRGQKSLQATQARLSAAERRVAFLETETSLLRKQLANMKLTTLKSQINPHFVFNCLNGIHSAIITGETDRAKEYVSGFARLLRMVLMHAGSNLLSLKEEMDMLEYYLKLERLRTSEAFNYTVEVDPAISPTAIRLPGMLIQPFLENAIWHGLMAKEGDKQLYIRWIQLQENTILCEVEDNGIGRNLAALRCNIDLKSGVPHQSKGMEICLERIELYRSTFNSSCRIDIEDLLNEHEAPIGTRVKIIFEVNTEMEAAIPAA